MHVLIEISLLWSTTDTRKFCTMPLSLLIAYQVTNTEISKNGSTFQIHNGTFCGLKPLNKCICPTKGGWESIKITAILFVQAAEQL